MTQPRSQRPESEVCPRRATDAKAEVNSPTATKSGSFVQSTKAHPRLAFLSLVAMPVINRIGDFRETAMTLLLSLQ